MSSERYLPKKSSDFRELVTNPPFSSWFKVVWNKAIPLLSQSNPSIDTLIKGASKHIILPYSDNILKYLKIRNLLRDGFVIFEDWNFHIYWNIVLNKPSIDKWIKDTTKDEVENILTYKIGNVVMINETNEKTIEMLTGILSENIKYKWTTLEVLQVFSNSSYYLINFSYINEWKTITTRALVTKNENLSVITDE